MIKKWISIVGAIIGFIVILVFSGIGGLVGEEAGKAIFSPPKPTEEEVLAKLSEGFEVAAMQINDSAPTMVDEETRMDRATVGPGPLLTYHYTLPNYEASQLGSDWVQADLRNSVKEGVCAAKEMKLSLEYGGKYQYRYSGKNGELIGSFILDRKDCDYAAKLP